MSTKNRYSSRFGESSSVASRVTIGRAFGGDAAAFARVDPIVVLARTRFPRNAGVFVGGANDRVYTPQQQIMYLAARHARVPVRAD
jgi:hypothetical protein